MAFVINIPFSSSSSIFAYVFLMLSTVLPSTHFWMTSSLNARPRWCAISLINLDGSCQNEDIINSYLRPSTNYKKLPFPSYPLLSSPLVSSPLLSSRLVSSPLRSDPIRSDPNRITTIETWLNEPFWDPRTWRIKYFHHSGAANILSCDPLDTCLSLQ